VTLEAKLEELLPDLIIDWKKVTSWNELVTRNLKEMDYEPNNN